MFGQVKAAFNKGRSKGQGIMGMVIGIAFALIIVAIVLPIGLEELGDMRSKFETDGSLEEMSEIEPLLLTLLPVVAVIGVVYGVIRLSGLTNRF